MSYSFTDFEEKIGKAIDHVRREVGMLRTGRASADILDSVSVEAYGQRMKLTEVASISVPDATLIRISPWDKSLIGAIEKAIAGSDLNLNPVVDGDIVRIAIAPLTEEKRKEMVKELHKRVEQGKAMLRDIRTKAKQEIEGQKGKDGVSEDDIEAELEELEERQKKATDQLDTLAAAKEKDLLTL
ncbi:MAG: ribosome recycling factor [Patescibacteria group bacterium]|nr:ribosome recycling factor [Patescibacteria group bacterium]